MSDAKSTTKRAAKRDSRSAASRSALSTLGNLPLDKHEALHLREQMAHRQGFRLALERASAVLADASSKAWREGEDAEAESLRKAFRWLDATADAVVDEYYRDTLDGVDFDACLDILIKEQKS